VATPLPASPLAYAACFDSVLVCSDCHRAITPGEWYWKRQIHNYHEDDDEWEWDPREDPPEDYWLEGMLGSTLLCRWCVKLKGYKKDRTFKMPESGVRMAISGSEESRFEPWRLTASLRSPAKQGVSKGAASSLIQHLIAPPCLRPHLEMLHPPPRPKWVDG
jgi:hypothetical protein